MEKFLNSKTTTAWIMSLSIFVLIFKTAPVLHNLSYPQPNENQFFWFCEWLLSFLSVSLLEIGVLLFVAKGKRVESIGFAVVSFCSTMFYFNDFKITPINLNFMHFVWSLAFPFIIVRFSHIYKEDKAKIDTEKQIIEFENKVDALNLVIKQSEKEKESNILLLKQIEKELEETKLVLERSEKEKSKYKLVIQEEKDSRTCQGCGVVFDNVKSLAGHRNSSKNCK